MGLGEWADQRHIPAKLWILQKQGNKPNILSQWIICFLLTNSIIFYELIVQNSINRLIIFIITDGTKLSNHMTTTPL